MLFSRRQFLLATLGISFYRFRRKPGTIITVLGEIPADALGKTLVHEHMLVDFIGADKISYDRWNRDQVEHKVLPYLLEAKQAGVKSIFDCTPAFLGRDVILLKRLSEKTGLHMITNTGYYGAVNNKYLPVWVKKETDKQLASRWIREFKEGIENSDVRPGFIKISVDAGKLSALHQKLVRAAALTHLETGLTICSHTGKSPAAFEQLDILKIMGVKADAFVWVHAQAETDRNLHIKAARRGAWISLDGIGWGDFENYADSIASLKQEHLLHRVLISHDAGWYKPGEPDGGKFTGFTNIFTQLIPLLNKLGFTQADYEQLLIKNPASAFALSVKAG
ncbi:phosphotriesterase-related protein [Mucilaginibacter lappiensis]